MPNMPKQTAPKKTATATSPARIGFRRLERVETTNSPCGNASCRHARGERAVSALTVSGSTPPHPPARQAAPPPLERVNHKRIARVMRSIDLAGVRLRRRHRATIADPARRLRRWV